MWYVFWLHIKVKKLCSPYHLIWKSVYLFLLLCHILISFLPIISLYIVKSSTSKQITLTSHKTPWHCPLPTSTSFLRMSFNFCSLDAWSFNYSFCYNFSVFRANIHAVSLLGHPSPYFISELSFISEFKHQFLGQISNLQDRLGLPVKRCESFL